MKSNESKLATPAQLNDVAKRFKTKGTDFTEKVNKGRKNAFDANVKRVEKFADKIKKAK
jgi:hypothetical protein